VSVLGESLGLKLLAVVFFVGFIGLIVYASRGCGLDADGTKCTASREDITKIRASEYYCKLVAYRDACGRFPTTEQGLIALAKPPARPPLCPHYPDVPFVRKAEPPKDGWGDGEVRLVEIPSQAETNDNIVAFWVSRWPARKGERKEYNYLLSALDDEAALAAQARVTATRAGAVPNAPKQRRIAVEFAGGELGSLAPEQPVEAKVALNSGKVMRTYVEPLPSRQSWRLFIEFEPDGKKPVDLRASLGLRGRALTETWSYVWRP